MMTVLPWVDAASTETGPLVVSVTRLRLARWRDVPAFLRAAMRLRREFPDVPGAVTLGLAAEPWRRTFWTLSAWRDEESLKAYVRSPGHAAAMRRFARAMADPVSARWTSDGGRPSWEYAVRRLDEGPDRTSVRTS